jgi:alcohol dehydrogenase class IV
MKNDKEIVDKINKLRNGYQVELEDTEEETMSFLDEINDLIRKIFDDSSLSVYTVFSQENLDKWKKHVLHDGSKTKS